MKCVLIIVLIFMAILCHVTSKPTILETILGIDTASGSYPSYGYQGTQRKPQTNNRQNKGRSYNDICRVVNPNRNYAFPNQAPFPAQPFCPY